MKIILPLRAKMGMKDYWHATAVHASKGDKIGYIEPGDEALYPSATEHRIVEQQHDDDRRNVYRRDRAYVEQVQQDVTEEFGIENIELMFPSPLWKRSRFTPSPFTPQDVPIPDVVVCPRWRRYGEEKNWLEWPGLTARLRGVEITTFAAGAPDSSYDVSPHDRAWSYDRHLDATIEAMSGTKLVVATDAGLAHLAVLCGVPLLMITYGNCLVAPGPITSELGEHIEDHYWRVKIERYKEANHTGSEITLLKHSWYDADLVFNEILRRVT